MKVRYKFRFYPTKKQEEMLAKTFGCCRWVYNWGLGLISKAYRERFSYYYATREETKTNYAGISRLLTEVEKRDDKKWLAEVPNVALRQATRNLDTAFKNFFNGNGKYPTFKKKHSRQSVTFSGSGSFKWDATTKSLSPSRIGKLKVRWSRDFQSVPKTATITKSPSGKYFVSLTLDEVINQLPKTGKEVGIDRGLTDLIILSTGEKVENPKYMKHAEDKLIRDQRRLSKKTKGSGRWNRQRIIVAKDHERVSRMRDDFLHKLSYDLVKRFDAICIEDLQVKNMIKNHHLARSIADASWGRLKDFLSYKSAWYGKNLVIVDKFFPSSKFCHVCEHRYDELTMEDRSWTCPNCGTIHDRDENAAINLLKEGKRLLAEGYSVTARGERVRRTRANPGRSVRRSVNPCLGNRHDCLTD